MKKKKKNHCNWNDWSFNSERDLPHEAARNSDFAIEYSLHYSTDHFIGRSIMVTGQASFKFLLQFFTKKGNNN